MRHTSFLLFGCCGAGEGGGHDFLGAYATQEDAQIAALELSFVHEPRLSSWVHLARFDGIVLKVTHWLNIPDTEFDEYSELVWVTYD